MCLSESDERYPVNLGNPTEMTILEFAQEIQSRFGDSVQIEYKPLPSDDPKLRQPDIAKAKRLLDWEPHVSLHDGLGVTIDYFRNKAGNARKLFRASCAPIRRTLRLLRQLSALLNVDRHRHGFRVTLVVGGGDGSGCGCFRRYA